MFTLIYNFRWLRTLADTDFTGILHKLRAVYASKVHPKVKEKSIKAIFAQENHQFLKTICIIELPERTPFVDFSLFSYISLGDGDRYTFHVDS